MEQKRMRSPGYPSMGVGEAIDIIQKMFSDVRTSAVDRDVAAKAMGYNGITGRSGKVLSDLVQYSLLEKAGKNEVRVSKVAVEILHPDSQETKAQAVIDASFNPELFQELKSRFPDSVPSDMALRSYLTKRGFTDAALPAAIRAYVDTSQYAEQFKDYGSHGQTIPVHAEPSPDQNVTEPRMQISTAQTSPHSSLTVSAGVPTISMSDRGLEISGGVITTIEQFEKLIRRLSAAKQLLDEPDDIKPSD